MRHAPAAPAVLASDCNDPLVLTMPLGASLSADVTRGLSVTAVVSVAPKCIHGSTLRLQWSLASTTWDPMSSPTVQAAFNRSVTTVTLPGNLYAMQGGEAQAPRWL